jgi:DNA-binding NtrC family response regulator
MSASIVLVHDVAEFVESTANALRAAAYRVTTFSDTMAAIDALGTDQPIDLLITRVQYPQGQPNGVALARMARVKRPGIQVLFVGVPERLPYTEGVGELLEAPVGAADIVAAAGRLLVAAKDRVET